MEDEIMDKDKILILVCMGLAFLTLSMGYGATININGSECYNITNTSDSVCAITCTNTICQPINMTVQCNATCNDSYVMNITANMSQDFSSYFIKTDTYQDCITRLIACQTTTNVSAELANCQDDLGTCTNSANTQLSNCQNQLTAWDTTRYYYAVGGFLGGIAAFYFYRQNAEKKPSSMRHEEIDVRRH
jgi:hypothetical protein